MQAIEVTEVQERLARLEEQKGIVETSAETEPRTETGTPASDEYQRGMRDGLELARSALKRGLDRLTP